MVTDPALPVALELLREGLIAEPNLVEDAGYHQSQDTPALR
jgi:hypothetical protein